MFTATRQWMDIFIANEQDMLTDVEPTMLSIRRIMNQKGGLPNDGDFIPTDDQSYIVDNVLARHPDNDAKLGSGMDHLMVSKHNSFQDSRFLYVVSVDGQKQDFSYRKCLENLVKKYPDLSESFFSKYWRRPRNDEASTRPGTETTRITTTRIVSVVGAQNLSLVGTPATPCLGREAPRRRKHVFFAFLISCL